MRTDRRDQFIGTLKAFEAKATPSAGGPKALVDLLNRVDRSTERLIIDSLTESNPELAEQVKNMMFVFEDIRALDDRAIRELLKEVSNEELTMALKGASEDLKQKFFKNLSERAGNMIREDLEIMGPVRLADVEGAQQNVVKTVRRLEAEGKIAIGRGGGDVFI